MAPIRGGGGLGGALACRSTIAASWEREGMGVKVPSRQKQKGMRVALGFHSKPEEVPLDEQNLMLPLDSILRSAFFLHRIEKVMVIIQFCQLYDGC
jgi:hypothetical protein